MPHYAASAVPMLTRCGTMGLARGVMRIARGDGAKCESPRAYVGMEYAGG